MVSRCDPCQRLAKSNIQEEVEVSHTPLFNIYPGHTIHVDHFELNNRDFTIMVDRLTGFSMCEMTPNKGTDAAVLAIRNWGNRYGYPYKVISDTGPVFRDDFIRQLLTLDKKTQTSQCLSS